jgi:hypothetical protein
VQGIIPCTGIWSFFPTLFLVHGSIRLGKTSETLSTGCLSDNPPLPVTSSWSYVTRFRWPFFSISRPSVGRACGEVPPSLEAPVVRIVEMPSGRSQFCLQQSTRIRYMQCH